MHNIWANLQENPSEDIQALAKSGIEALEKKMSKWNEKYLMAGCYLDPKMRLQLYSLIDKSKFLSKSKVSLIIKICLNTILLRLNRLFVVSMAPKIWLLIQPKKMTTLCMFQ